MGNGDLSPLGVYLEERKQRGEKKARQQLLDGFSERGWPCTTEALGYWIRAFGAAGFRVPSFLNQLRLEVVSGGEVRPEDWVAYLRRCYRAAGLFEPRKRRRARGAGA